VKEDRVDTILAVRNLRTNFYTSEGVVRAVNGISYDVRRGETFAIVGESGCGKSVSALSVMGLIPVPPGRVEADSIIFDGRNLLAMDLDAMRMIRGSEMAMIFQEPMTSLNPVLTIGLQLSETLEVHLNISRKEAKRRVIEVLKLVGMTDPERRLQQYPHEFSGGMRQRVMIAMAISCNPKLILADEPTTALDVTIQAQILELLKEITRSQDVAMIIITHNLGVVARYANRVNVMYAGKIVESSSSTEIYKHPRHPYTLGLLHSVPRLDQPRKNKLDPIQGQPPELTNLPSGCSFVPRCKFAGDRCQTETPQLSQVDSDHWCACWMVEKLIEET
jgi:oligopeptide/dipeptide ABC transporter ATP-binding protein